VRRWIGFILVLIVLGGLYGLRAVLADVRYIVQGEPGAVLYATGFDDSAEDWVQYEGRLSAQVLDGQLRIRVDESDNGAFSYAEPVYSDFVLSTRAAALDGPIDNGYGVLFRLDTRDNRDTRDDRYYTFLISTDGYYRVTRVSNGQAEILSDWIPCDAIRAELGAYNDIRVEGRGSRFRFFINGTPVQLCVPDTPGAISTYALDSCIGGSMVDMLEDSTLPSGRIGVVGFATATGGPGVVIAFDQVIVEMPSAADEN
jgi:hypothetical protein